MASSHTAGVGIRLGTLRGSYSRGVSPGDRNRTRRAWGGCSAQRGRTLAGWQPGAWPCGSLTFLPRLSPDLLSPPSSRPCTRARRKISGMILSHLMFGSLCLVLWETSGVIDDVPSLALESCPSNIMKGKGNTKMSIIPKRSASQRKRRTVRTWFWSYPCLSNPGLQEVLLNIK